LALVVTVIWEDAEVDYMLTLKTILYSLFQEIPEIKITENTLPASLSYWQK